MSNSKLALYLTAEKYRLVKNYSRALPLYEQIIQLEPNDLGVLKKLASMYEKEAMHAQATDTYVKIARAHLILQQTELAREAVSTALGFTPDHADALRLQQEMAAIETGVVDSAAAAAEPSGIRQSTTPPVKLDTPLFKDLTEEQWESVVKVVIPLKIMKDTVVFHEGDLSNSLYIVKEGSFEVRTKITDGAGVAVDTVFSILGQGQFFGEFAFLTGSPRVATVRAREDSEVYQFTKADLDEIVKGHPEVEGRLFLFYKSRALDMVLAKSSLFHTVPAEERRELLEHFVLRKFKPGELIIREGQRDDNLFLIKKGELRVETTDLKGRTVFLSTLSQHQFFGEISFLTGVPRTATITAASDVELLLIGREDLVRVIKKYPNIEQILRRFQQSRADETLKRMTSQL